MTDVPFNRPTLVGREHEYVADAVARGQISADGIYTARSAAWLEDRVGVERALLTPSCTAALELAALLLDLGPGDEVIMPSFTFVSTASAVVLRGATPVFVDIRADTLNLDERLVEAAITERTKAIVLVHYAGVPCELDAFEEIAARHGIPLVEDAAQALLSRYKGRSAGSAGVASALSFHETKNVSCGEGGALLLRDAALVDRAEILRDKGTDRKRFFRGLVDKYSWVDVGSSFGLSDLSAAFLYAQLEVADELLAQRMERWLLYDAELAELDEARLLRRPRVPEHVDHNAHTYAVLVASREVRDGLIGALATRGINAVFHYVPLHSSTAGLRYGRASGSLPTTDWASDCLVRLPLWNAIPHESVLAVTRAVREVLRGAPVVAAPATP
jgi:dTDP-4-amino-4,6-dideoxygalactose transaminase